MYPSALKQFLRRIKYKDWHFEVDEIAGGDGVSTFRACFFAPDSATGRLERQEGREWLVPWGTSESEIVRTAFLAIQTAEEHERRETFTFDGAPIFAPHFNAEQLAAAWHEAHPR